MPSRAMERTPPRGKAERTPTPRREACATARWEALGTGVVLRVTDPLWLPRASAILVRELDAIDRACSRFRTDSDLSRVNAHAGGAPVAVAPLLIEALQVALRAAEITAGDVDPTVGAALVLAETGIRAEGECPPASAETGMPPKARSEAVSTDPGMAPGHRETTSAPTLIVRRRSARQAVELNLARGTVRIPRGVALDLGATAKAWAADRGAQAVQEAAGCGVLVSIGGDIATAGPPPAGGWRIHVTDDHRSSPDAPGQTISVESGGLATSSVTVRRWQRGAHTAHHIIDPSRGAPARGPWRTVSVAAADCTDANIAATAALVRGARAASWLKGIGLPARLVAHDGAVLRLGAWPSEPPVRKPPSDRPPTLVVGHGGPTPGRLVAAARRADDPQ